MKYRQWYKGKTVLVTGGTSGIGREMVVRLCQWGAKVIVCGRSPERLDSLKAELDKDGLKLSAFFLIDMSEPASLKKMIEDIERDFDLDILVNNAGLGYIGTFDEMDQGSIEDLQKLNMQALTTLTRSFIGPMKAKGGGGILNVGSVASFFPAKRAAFYCGTKHFVLGFTDTLHLECLPYSVHVSGVYPGKTHSSFVERATKGKLVKWEEAMAAGEVAEQALKGLAANKPRVITGLSNRIIVLLTRILPAAIMFNIMAKREVQN